MANKLTEQILGYMDDTSARYAIALEGDWGSGKTRFCEGELKESLTANGGYAMVRVSLYGISDAASLYARIAMAMVHLSVNDEDESGLKVVKRVGVTAARGGVSLLKKKLKDMGVDVDVPPEILSSVLGKNQLLVLDDYERNGFSDKEEGELFGAIASLVEGQGCKVMLITNDFSKMGEEFREKLVWRCYRFESDPSELVDAILVPRLTHAIEGLDFDVNRCVRRSAVAAHCTNARAMIKASALINMAFESNVACDPGVDITNREAALCDFIRFALLAAMGAAPQRPAERDPDAPLDYERVRAINDFDRYSQLDVIDDHFSAKSDVSSAEVDVCMARYAMARYAGSPETMRVARLLEKMRDVQSMEDDEVARLASELSYCILRTRFDFSYLGDAIRTNWTLRHWGFEESADPDEVFERAKELVDENPVAAYRRIHRECLLWHEEWSDRYDGAMAKLDEYVVDVYERQRRDDMLRGINPGDPRAGGLLAKTVQDGWQRGEDLFLEFAPSCVAACFVGGNAISQRAIYDMVTNLENRAVLFSCSDAKKWVQLLLREMCGAEPTTRMGLVRKGWTVDVLEKLSRIEDGRVLS